MERTKAALVVGASGYIGRYLCKVLSKTYRVFGTFYRNPVSFQGESNCVDIRNGDAVQNLVHKVRPDIIFHLAWDPNDLERCIVAGTRNLLGARNENCSSCGFIFLSTDAVFDGENGPFKESDIPRPIFSYGVAKRKAEIDTLTAGGTVVRTSLVYGFEPMDPRTSSLLHGLKTGEFEYSYFADEIRCPIFVEDLCYALIKLSLSNINQIDILHLAGPEAISRYDFAIKLAKLLGYDPGLIPRGLLSEAGIVRPIDLTIDSSKANKLIDFKCSPVHQLKKF